VIADALAEGNGMAKEEAVEKVSARTRAAPAGPKPQAAPAAVDETPSEEEAAAIAASTVFEPDLPEPEIVAEDDRAAEDVEDVEDGEGGSGDREPEADAANAPAGAPEEA
jgi:hypothetical protein